MEATQNEKNCPFGNTGQKSVCDMDELIAQCDMLLAVFESMGDAVYYTDRDRRILAWNRVAEHLTGYTQEEVRGHLCRDILNHTDSDGTHLCDKECPLLEVAQNPGKRLATSVWMKTKNGQRILIEMSCTSVTDRNGAVIGMVEVFRDRTQQWELERMKEEFVATITHDLKSPIAAIMGFTELLADPRFGEISQNKLEYTKAIRQSGSMVLALISNIVDASRIEAGQMLYNYENFPIDEFMIELKQTFESLIMRGKIDLLLSYPEGEWTYADRPKILQVFHNLISNALRYTPNGGTISVNVTGDDNLLRFEVADTGKGIPEADQTRIFEKYQQGKSERRGTGLGLFIVKTILEGHGSSITVESETGKGTRFFFSLRKGEMPTEKIPKAGSLLLVGDESETMRLTRLILQKAGHTVETSGSGLDALQKATSLKPDLILVYHPLPDLMVEDLYYGFHTSPSLSGIPIALFSAVRIPEWEKMFREIIALPVNTTLLGDTVQRLLSPEEQ